MSFRFLLALLPILLLASPAKAQLVITEFLASNNSGLRDELDNTEDWIEIHNPGTASVSLSGWYLTDNAAVLNKWAFPAWTLGAGNRLLVFASNRDRRPAQTTPGSDNAGTIASPRLATNFKISTGAGGFLALCKDQTVGVQTIVSQFSNYPKQSPDFSFGRGVGAGSDLFAPGQAGLMRYQVGTAAVAADWFAASFDDSSWTAASGTAIGFDADYSGATSYKPFFTVDLGSATQAAPSIPSSNPMYAKASTLFARYAFPVADKSAFGGLTLKLRYEDGFVAYLNGVEIARGNFAGTPAHNSTTTTARTETLAIAEDQIDVTTTGLPALVNGTNVLAIVGINGSASSNDFLLAPVLNSIPVSASNILMMPSPGAANGTATIPSTLSISAPSGLFTGNLSVTISGQQPSQIVRYTTNGTEPTMSLGNTYTGPIPIAASTTLKARLFYENLGGPLVDANYILRGSIGQYGITPDTFSSALPLLVIDSTAADAVTSAVAQPARFSLIDRSIVDQRASLTATPAFTTRGTLNIRGQSSSGLAKKGYAIEFQNASDRDKNLPVLGMPADSDWILYASYQFDANFMRNVLMYEFYRRTGRWAPQTRFVEVFLNPAGASVDGADYLGVYVLMEKIKLDSNRINLNGVTPLDNAGDDLTGAYLFAHDKRDGGAGNPANELLQSGTLPNWSTGENFIVKEPNYLEITTAQLNYLRDLILQVDITVGTSNFTNPSTGKHYRDYIARDSFIDNHMFNAFSKNVDGLRISTYFQKDRLGKIQMSSIWDFDRSMDCDTDDRDDVPTEWNSGGTIYTGGASTDFFSITSNNAERAEGWFHRLHQDPDYMQEWVDRYDRWRKAGIIDAAAMSAFLDQKAAELTVADNGGTANANTPIARNFGRWSRTTRGVSTNGSNAASVIFGTGSTSELSRQKTWIQNRIAFMDTYVLKTPSHSVFSGTITSSTPVSITSPDSSGGTLFYTLDGTDPRASGGGISTSAKTYSSAITVPTSGFVTSRLRKTGVSPASVGKHTDWSAPQETYYLVGATRASSADLRVSELMYHPADPSPAEIAAGFTDSDNFEFIEFLNTGTGAINLYGAKIVAGVDFDFSEALKPALLHMAPGDRIIVAKNLAAFTLRHGATAATRVIGEFADNDNLNNAGEIIAVNASDGNSILTFAYSPLAPWPTTADGLGYSLVLADTASGANLSLPASWRTSTSIGGSPGGAEPGPTLAAFNGTHFTAGELLVANISGPGADPDGDGLSNLLEYALGSNPRGSSSSTQPLPTLPSVSGETHAALTFRRRQNTTDLTFVLEVSTTPGNSGFAPVPATATVVTVHGDGTETITLRETAPLAPGTTTRFVRLRVEQN